MIIKRFTFLLSIVLLFSIGAFAQTPPLAPPPYTVATLPSPGGVWKGKVVTVTDGATKGDCTVGGGSWRGACESNGTAWSNWGGDGTGSGGTPVAGVTGTAPIASSGGVNPDISFVPDSTHRLVTDTEKSTWNGKQDGDPDLTGIAALSPSNDDVIQRKAGAWTNRTLAQLRADLTLVIGTNVEAWDPDLDAIAALAGTSGFLKKIGTNSWTLDTNTYLTANQTITLSGDASGSGATSITVTNTKVNGVVYGSSPATNTVPVVTGSNTVTYQAVPSAALNLTTTTCTNQVVTAISAGGVGTCAGVSNTMLTGSIAFSKLLGTDFGTLSAAVTDTYDLGTPTLLWRKGWLSELDAVLFAQNTQTVLGGWLVIAKNEGTIPVGQDVASGNTTIDFGQSMTVSDFVVFRAAAQVEYVQVGSLSAGTRYNVTRNLDGSGANAWPAGSVYVVLGNTGNGRIELNANATPRISMLTQGATYNAQTELLRMGDLNGGWGYGAETYGFAVGDSSATNLTIDATNGFRIRFGTTNKLVADTLGNLSIVGDMTIGTAGSFRSGATAFFTGNGYFLDYNAGTPRFRVGAMVAAAIITPANVVGGSFTANVFTKSAADATWGNSGFSSVEAIVADGYIQWTVAEANKFRMVGLSTSDPDQGITSIQYAWHHRDDGALRIFESGTETPATPGLYTANVTVLKIERVGTTLTYYKDGVSQRVVTGVTTAPLFVDSASYSINATVGPITMYTGALGAGFSWDGAAFRIVAGVGHLTIDNLGLNLIAETNYNSRSAVNFTDAFGVVYSALYEYDDSSTHNTMLDSLSYAGRNNAVQLRALAPAGKTSSLTLAAYVDSVLTANLNVNSANGTTVTGLFTIGLNNAMAASLTDLMVLKHNAASGSPSIGTGTSILFNIVSSTTIDRNAGRIGAVWTTVTDASRASALVFQTVTAAGALTERVRIGVGLVVGAPTGGDKGAGTANFAADIYKNNVAYTSPDFVFEKWATGRIERFADKPGAGSYLGLMPLEDLRSYVLGNYHLPGFGQNAGHGLFSGGEQLLMSVEQSYLYIFELNTRLKALEAKIAEIEKRRN